MRRGIPSMRVTAILLALFLAMLCAAPLGAQGTAVVEGYVRDGRGNPLPHHTVVLKADGGMQVDRTMTDREGHYKFFQIGAGTFYVTVELKPPQMADAMRIEILAGERDAHRRADIIVDTPMLPRPASPSPEPIFLQEAPPEAESAYNEAIQKLNAGNSDEGLPALERAVQIFPAYFRALNRLGVEYLQRGDVAKTKVWSERAVAVNPNSASAQFALGWTFYQDQKLEDAARALRASATLNPSASETHWYLGMTALEQKQWAEAERAFASFSKLYTRDDRPTLHLYLTSAYDHLQRYDEAVRSLETYLRLVPERERTAKLNDLLGQLRRKRAQAQAAGASATKP